MKPESLDLKKLRAFQLVAQQGSLRRAAMQLHITIPAVSLQIRRLEQDLGVSLFKRLPNRLMLTNAGEILLRETITLYEHVERAVAMLRPNEAPRGHLSIATSSDWVRYFSQRISSYIKRFPGVDVSLHVFRGPETIAMIGRGDLDIGIGYFPKRAPGIGAHKVAESTVTLACPPGHRLLREQPLLLSDVARHRLLLLPSGSATRHLIDRVLSKAGVHVKAVTEAGNCHTALEFAERGLGVALVHSLCCGQNKDARLSYVDLSQQFGKIDLSVIYRSANRRLAALQGLLDELGKRATA
jgi:LysR family transcriptional regulator, low CO2-responsive transcriptional regulator